MIYITQLIYILDDKEDVFNRFEYLAIPILKKYNASLLLRVRPNGDTIIESNIDPPHEIHFIQFDTELDFQNFLGDKERLNFLHLKKESILTSLLIKGEKI